MVEVEKEYASKGVAGAGLGTGIAGLSLGVLNALGGLGGMAPGMQRNNCGCNTMPMCNEAMPVTRYDLGREQEIAAKVRGLRFWNPRSTRIRSRWSCIATSTAS